MFKKFKKWLIYKLGGIPKESYLEKYFKTTSYQIIPLKEAYLIDSFTLENYPDCIVDTKKQLIYNFVRYIYDNNLIDFKEEQTHYGKVITAQTYIAKERE